MPHVVNFLPWRSHRRRRCAYKLLATVITTCLALGLIIFLWRAWLANNLLSIQLRQQTDEALLTELRTREQSLQKRFQHWLLLQEQALRRQNTQAWRQTLLELAAILPQQAWLTQLRWQQNQLELSGLARSFGALNEFEQRLHKMDGFHLQQTGATVRDAQGYWQFHYQLSKENADATRH
ncbi:PilN domain-containing protein [Salmonella enterica]